MSLSTYIEFRKVKMKKIELSRAINTLANLGVIAGIVFLIVELDQNNELLELEAKAILSQNLQDGWDRIASDPELVDVFIKDRNEKALSESEEFRLNAYWMGMLLRREWQFQHFPESNDGLDSMRRIYASYGSFRRAWNGNSSGSRAAGKDNFSPEFVKFLDETIFVEP